MADYNPTRSDARRVDDSSEEIFPQYPIASWTVDGGQKIVFPCDDIQETGGNRLVRRKRPYREGAKLDDTGREPFVWRISSTFHNSIQEPGLEQNGEALYPNILNWLIWTFEEHYTGDLVIPTRGVVRARADTYERRESSLLRDGATLTITFVEDNEDGIDAQSIGSPSVNATAIRLAEEAQFSAQKEGVETGSLQDFRHSLAQLEGLMNAPRQYAADIQEVANIIVLSSARVARTMKDNADWTRRLFMSPPGNRAERTMLRASDRAGAAKIQAQQHQPQKRGVIFEHDQSIASISAMLDMDYEDLLYMNTQLANPSYIPKGTLVYVEENATLSRYG